MTLEIIGRVAGGEDLTQAEMAAAIDAIMRGQWEDEQIALLLTALYHKGETVEEIAGAAAAMRRHMTPIRSPHPISIDTCGTGGDGSGTFNISTAAALVTAAAGVPVAKHGNRSITSKTGSADVLAELGVNIGATVSQAEFCLETVGICFCFAPLLHPSMRHVGQVRRQLGFRTIFNLLGPLCNPANATYQLLGVGRPELRPKLAAALSLLGSQGAVVVSGEDGLDEVTLCGRTNCTSVHGSELAEFAWHPHDFGIAPADNLLALTVEDPAGSATIIRSVLDGISGPARDIVVLNAAAALWTVGRGEPTACAQAAAEAIDSGAARDTLQRLAAASHRA